MSPVANLRWLLVAMAIVGWAGRVDAYPSYDDDPTAGVGTGCVTCHPAFFGVSGLHTNHLTKFGIQASGDCTLCHQTTAGEKPVLTYWSNGGFGCSGCHGQNYGETIPTGLGLSHEGNPKSSGYGLRRKHALIFAAMSQADVCSTCHFPGSTITGDPDPAPAALPETVAPPYYGKSTINLTNPCDSSQESFSGTPPGLDNDGNGEADMDDSACMAFVSTTTVSSTTVTTTSSTSTTTFPGTAKRITVYPGQSIQDAVDAVMPGGTVYIMPGVYQETHLGQDAVTVSKNGIRLIGRSKPKQGLKVVLKPLGAQHSGIVVQPAVEGTRIDGFQVKGITIEGFPNNGIVTRYLDNFKIERNESINNLENGIWPTLSANGIVKRNVAYGSEDSALWVEASENVRVLKNELYDSPTGLEITVSQNVEAKQNDVHDNTVGIGLYHALGAGLPPLLPLERNGDWEITDNHVHDNNSTNNAPPGSLAGMLPPGIGILLVGVDRVTVKDNLVENNNTIGLAMADWCLVTTCPSPFPPGIPNTIPEDNTVVKNVFTNNAQAPASGYEALAADMTYAVVPGTPSNCFADNEYATFIKVGMLTEANKCK